MNVAMLLLVAQTVLPYGFPGPGVQMPTPPPALVARLDADGVMRLHVVAHPTWDPASYEAWIADPDAAYRVAVEALIASQATLPKNPSEIAFASPDHAIITDYEIGFFLTGATQPVQVNKQTKPGLSSDNDVHLTFTSRPLGLGLYELKVRAYAPSTTGGTPIISPWSGAVPFERALEALGMPRIVR